MKLLDRYQPLEIALKLTKRRNEKAKEGGYAGGRATFGYMKQTGEKVLKIHNNHAEGVKRFLSLKDTLFFVDVFVLLTFLYLLVHSR
ncbi:hypothetical protein [Bacillus weihaiensis]|uniref:hypothetical protein n=1 Tax=Bacillus weihaiensis TaxID=1547283 RepID=UPI0023566681|nr:hypothetical protein [Bacillus weihaiensis]